MDLSHLHTAALDVFLRPVDVAEVLAVARDGLGPGGREPTVELPEDLPDVLGDAALLTRVVTNLVAAGWGAVPRYAAGGGGGDGRTVPARTRGVRYRAPPCGRDHGPAVRLVRDVRETLLPDS
ncbi:hypothetical protein GTZ78_12960 [Streptomyces sp. SID8361]|uniref:hypothetical protein n=1 Tax=Streptomyces sp. MnatMP-M27 TaxID=1839768 RepID=UPI00114D2BA8|nr:hypothetical protein [Streptomyces sp. MnatMP-M27]MYU11587.1 hypothetical protein [Streptomyces sp. SID8361]